ncbi:ESCRT-III component [Saitoella complicata NRRL Y-17804]|uniref:ESCRT-III component n=1 Tax=Saitoella complicata (strain BCRC 22490 / CBS 7301 / JCM 7358 / NBRC 10748 / NRRL Y-17804) TaxID=698492 RepID=UPI000867805A|nr:ESCRT-III component [Saitoella complicata NRRL Y-17804]ODQ50310.1 ESCRT-III component [Saitoella complicata NRRL Y-17804]
MWGYLFGGSSQKKKDAPKEAILKLREQLLMLEKKESHLQKQIDEQTAIAKKNATTNKKAALRALRTRKTLENALDQLASSRQTIETQVYSIENANVNFETMKAMKAGAEAMKTIHKGMSIDKVDATMDEIREQIMLGDEVAEAISRPVGIGNDVDETELEEELEMMEQEELDSKMLGVGGVPVHIPASAVKESQEARRVAAPPVHATAEDDDEEAELRALQAEMAM